MRQSEDFNLDWDSRQRKREEVIALSDEIDRRYGQDRSLVVRAAVAEALLHKGEI